MNDTLYLAREISSQKRANKILIFPLSKRGRKHPYNYNANIAVLFYKQHKKIVFFINAPSFTCGAFIKGDLFCCFNNLFRNFVATYIFTYVGILRICGKYH